MAKSSNDQLLRLREQMISEKDFLRNIYSCNSMQAREYLNFATLLQLNILLRILHQLCSGSIKLKATLFDEIIRHKKLKILQTVAKPYALKKMLASSRGEKLTYLYKITNVLNYILNPLFVKRDEHDAPK
jgi:hypothetical protein